MSESSPNPQDTEPSRVYLVYGEDPGLVSQSLSSLLARLGALEAITPGAFEEYGEPGKDDPIALGTVLNACQTPPFLTARRVVVVRSCETFAAEELKELVGYVGEPLESTILILAFTGRVPAALRSAVERSGSLIGADLARTARARSQFVVENVRASGLRLDAAAIVEIADRLGEDVARLEGLLGALASAFGPGVPITASAIEPFLGEAGAIAPWEFTDALDAGDGEKALVALHRLLEGGERHPLQLLAVLHRHYGAMLRLDGALVSDEAAASAATGLSAFPGERR